ncbi:MAG: glycosyltransferase family 39 protein [Clostridia bacterium]|nr:glycosyltransferase family 39 protein [Clostridia bacterium]
MELLKSGINKHPYFSVFSLWLILFCAFGRFQIEGVTVFNYLSVVIFASIYLIAEKRNIKKKIKDEKNREAVFKKTALTVLLVSVYILLTLLVFSVTPSNLAIQSRNDFVPFAFLLAALIGYALYLCIKRKWSTEKIIMVIFLLGVITHLFYISYTDFNVRQNDIGFFQKNSVEHLGYVECIYRTGLPPQTDPSLSTEYNINQFYHPPLYHYLLAILLRMQTLCGVDIKIAIYNIQYIGLLCYMILLAAMYEMIKEFQIKKTAQCCSFAVITFVPTFFYMSGLVNNDFLCLIFQTLALLYTIKWYKNQKAKNIVKIALFFGLGMFTKLSAWMAAVPIAVIFITALFKKLMASDKKEFFRLFGQMWGFLGVAAPLSLYWSFRNYFRFGLPFGYVPQAIDSYDGISQLADRPLIERLFDFSLWQFQNPYPCSMPMGSDYNEFNPLIGLMKTASTGYTSFAYDNILFGQIILWANAVMMLLAFICMIVVLIKKDSIPVLWKVFFVSFYLVIIVSYYIFCIKFPYPSTEHIRYASPVIMIGAFFTGYAIKDIFTAKTKTNKIMKNTIIAIVSLFCLASLVYFIHMGYYTTFVYHFEF